MRFVAKKTDGGAKKGKISLYCRVLKLSRQGFYQYLARQERPWKYQGLADAMQATGEKALDGLCDKDGPVPKRPKKQKNHESIR